MSQIEFRTTKAKKMQIEFVYRRFIDKNLRRNDHILTELEGGDWYAIY